jgi:phospholipid/cholesterol/gamma-HCH transport system substrate-binding protein
MMDRDTNYAAVGAFVLVVLAMATVFVLWYTNASERREYQRYEVYFLGSVSGLTEGSTVRYLGVNVGRVARIRLDPRAGDRVQVLVDVDKATPVGATTLARLSMQGVTGLLFIDLSQSPQWMSEASPPVPSADYPVIRSMPSDFDRLIAGLPALVADATRVTRQLNRLLSDDNLADVRAIAANVRKTTEPLPAAAAQAAQLVTEVRALVAEAHAAARGATDVIHTSGPELEATLKELHGTAEALNGASRRVDALLARHEGDIDRFAGRGLDELTAVARASHDAADEVRELARTLREDPSRVLYQPSTRGVEIPR